MSDWMLLIMLTLGVYRVAHMAAYEVGPFDAFTELRSWAVNTFGTRHWISAGLGCPLCLSFWLSFAAAPFAGIYLLLPVWLYPVVWIGIAGGALVLNRFVEVRE